MEPDVFVGRERPLKLGSNNTNDISKHRDEDETSVKGKDETCTTGSPYGPLKSIQSSELGIGSLTVPPITEEEEVETVENYIEGKPSAVEEFSAKPAFISHCRRSESDKVQKEWSRRPGRC